MNRPGRHWFAGGLAITLASLLTGGSATVADDCGNAHVHNALLNLLPDGAEAVTAIADGNWSSPWTWDGPRPGPGDDVLIPEGITVTYDVNDDGNGNGADTTRFHFVRVDGVLTWSTSANTTMYVDTLFNSPGGEILIGTDENPIPWWRTAEIIIIADEPMIDSPQISRGIIPHGRNRIVGADVTDFAALDGDALAGEDSILLQETPDGWSAGDTIVLGGTSFDPNGSNEDNSRFHDEVLIITAIWGRRVWFDNTAPGVNGLQWNHVRPSGTHFSANDLNLYAANLTRNITFRSELDPNSPDAPGPKDIVDKRRGHHMVMHTPDSITRHAAFYDFGRGNKNFDIDESGTNVDGTPGNGLNVRGRYAFHHHRNLPQNNVPIDLATCEPAIVDGCVVWGSPGWGFTHHDSHCIFENNVAFDVLGSAFVQEAGNEIGIWRNNISIKTTGDDDPLLTLNPDGGGAKRTANFDFGFNGDAYWIQGGSQVECYDNIAISAAAAGANIFSDVHQNVNRDRGFIPVEHLPADIQHIVTTANGLISVNRLPANTFTGFEVYNADMGLVTWHHLRHERTIVDFNCPCDGTAHREYATIDGFRFWNIYGQGMHLQYTTQIEFRDGIVASADLATPGVDDKPVVVMGDNNGNGRGYGVAMNAPSKRLIFDDVIIEGWEFGIRTPNEAQINELDEETSFGGEGADGLPDRRSVFRDLKMANNGDHMYRRQAESTVQAFSNFLVIDGGDFADDVPNDPPNASFTFQSLGTDGVVRLSGLAAWDDDTPNGSTPYDDGEPVTNFSVARNDPNYITAYGWDLDNDGSIDEFGETIIAQFPLSIASPVTLTVWDHQGATDTVTLNVTPQPAAYPQLFVDGGFNKSYFNSGSQHSGRSDEGWFAKNATLDPADYVRFSGDGGSSWVSQSVYDNHVRRGDFRLNFDHAGAGGARSSDRGGASLRIRLWGINTEFKADVQPMAFGAVPFEAALLFDESFDATGGWTSTERIISLGEDGYTYYFISFAADGVSSGAPDDDILLDNITMTPDAVICSPADINGDGFVNVTDLLRVITCWGPVGAGCEDADVETDGDGLGVVNVQELLLVIGEWGSSCEERSFEFDVPGEIYPRGARRRAARQTTSRDRK